MCGTRSGSARSTSTWPRLPSWTPSGSRSRPAVLAGGRRRRAPVDVHRSPPDEREADGLGPRRVASRRHVVPATGCRAPPCAGEQRGELVSRKGSSSASDVHQRHRDAQRGEHARVLAADDAGAHHHQRARAARSMSRISSESCTRGRRRGTAAAGTARSRWPPGCARREPALGAVLSAHHHGVRVGERAVPRTTSMPCALRGSGGCARARCSFTRRSR